ncbi:MAG: hypothetical protein Q8J68_07895 [Methanolobus sp.]|uniref:hypothetical protein n=1 Tax=Methanolobus sp. TaxID=1874737 RepID=UPI00272F4719|nr:hypothetical protein [Methanolobus sp.]MDP2217190.1 hypothetical protein [Methanolobus sp.]
MPMEAGKNIQQNMKDRFTAFRDTIKAEKELVMGIVGDVKKRVIDGEELTYIQTRGIPGTRGGLSDVPLALVIGSTDVVTEGGTKQAKITRRWMKR